MKAKDYSTIKRMLGVIEGVASSLDSHKEAYIVDSVCAIDEILEKYGVTDTNVGNKDGKGEGE